MNNVHSNAFENKIEISDASSLVSHERFLKLSAEYEAEQKELTKFVKRSIVRAPGKSSGHRRQKIEIVWNFTGELEQGEDRNTIERQRKSKTA